MARQQTIRAAHPGLLLAVLLLLPLSWFACLSDAPDLRGFPCSDDSACGALRCLQGTCGGAAKEGLDDGPKGEASTEDAGRPETPDEAKEAPPESVSGLCKPNHPLPLPTNCDKRQRLYTIASPHGGGITAMAYHEGRKLLLTAATVAGQGHLILWSVRSNGSVVLKFGPFKGHTKGISALAWFPDGKAFVVGSADPEIHVWREDSKGIFAKGDKPFVGLAGGVSKLVLQTYPKEDILFGLGAQSKYLLLWHLQKSGAAKATIPKDPTKDTRRFVSFAMDADGKRIALSTRTAEVHIHAFDSEKLDLGKQEYILKGHTSAISAIAFGSGASSDWFATGDLVKKINVWNLGLTSLSPHVSYTVHEAAVTHLRFAPDDSFLVSAGNDGTIRFLGLRKGTPDQLQVLTPHKNNVKDLTFHNEGKHLTSVSFGNSIMTYEVKSGRLRSGLNGPHTLTYKMSIHPGGEELVLFDGAVKSWSIRSGEMRKRRAADNYLATYTDGAYSPNGRWLALVHTLAGVNTVEIRNAADHSLYYRWTPNTQPGGMKTPMAPITALVWTKDSQRLLIGGYAAAGARVLSLNLEKRAPTALAAFAENVHRMVLSPDDQRLIVGHVAKGKYTIRLWDWQPETPVAKAAAKPLTALHAMALSPDGKRLLISENGVLSYRVTSEALVAEEKIPWDGSTVYAIAFHPDSLRFALGDVTGRIGLWNPNTGDFTRMADGHTGLVRGLVWSLDGLHLISAGNDLRLFAWHCPCKPGERARCFTGPAAKRCVGLCREGTQTCNPLPNDATEGAWSACSVQVLPQYLPAGSGKDADCDGNVDP